MNLRDDFRMAMVLAVRELRHGLRGFGVFLGCLILGVFTITGVGTFSESARQGLLRDARSIMGGDLEIRITSRSLNREQEAFFRNRGTLSRVAMTRTMARTAKRSVLVELKGVDDAYPLYGSVSLAGGGNLQDLLAGARGMPGAVADRLLLDRLGLDIGDTVRIGSQSFVLRGVIASEPDRVVQAFALGPRMMTSLQALEQTGLTGPGSLVRNGYRVRLSSGDPKTVIKEAEAAYPDQGWSMRDYTRAAPRIRTLLERLDINLTLIGLGALLVGGLGISGAVRGYLEARIGRIAVMKCVGGTGPVLLGSYLLQVLIIGGIGSGIGMLFGSMVPWAASALFREGLPFHLASGIQIGPLVRAALFGICTTLAFSSRTLVMGVRVPPASLFRGYVANFRNGGVLALALPGFFFAVLVGLVFVFAGNFKLAAGFTVGTVGCFVLFRLAAGTVRFLSRKAVGFKNPSLRIGLAQIHRPGAPTSSLVFALGLGLTCLVAVALVNDNLTRALSSDIADRAPSFFFMDIQAGDADRFEAVVRSEPGVSALSRSPVIRGRITRLKEVPVSRAEVAPEVSWAVRGDRMFTFAGSMPDGTLLAEGEWWPSDYSGEPLISLTSDLARGFGMTVGDTLTVNVLGRAVTARVANIRDVDWSTLNMQFAVIFAPGPLNRAPHTWLAAVHADPGAESRVFSAVADTFPAVAIVRLRDVLNTVSSLFSRMALVFKGVSSLALITGFLVLAGTFSADQHRRIYDAVVYKVCGATRGDILLALITEFAVLGAATGIIACLTGGLAGWAVINGLMNMRFELSPGVVAGTVAAGTLIALFFGLAGTARVLGKKAGPYLRNE